MTFNYKLSITAQSEQDAAKKLRALAILGSKLSAEVLDKLADVVVHDPAKTEMAKKFLGV